MKAFYLIIFIFVNTLSAEIISVDFEKHPEGNYTNAMAKTDFESLKGASSWYAMEQNNGENAKIISDDKEHGQVLQLRYPANCLGPNDSPIACAGQIKQALAFKSKEVWLSYDVLFEENFDFVKGGKLPGLCGGKCYTGGNRPTTGDGWSARIMWRADGKLVQYLYFKDQASEYGDDAKWDLNNQIEQKQITPGVWHRFKTKITLNTVHTEGQGQKNGKIKSWFDDELVLDLDTLLLVDYDEQWIDVFYISTFHGGSDASWSPSIDSYARFDNFVISTDSIPLNILKPKIKRQSPTPSIILGNSSIPIESLKEDTYFEFYSLKGDKIQEKLYKKFSTQIQSPKNRGLYILKTKRK